VSKSETLSHIVLEGSWGSVFVYMESIKKIEDVSYRGNECLSVCPADL